MSKLKKGFSLVELLIALFVFSLLATLSFHSVKTLINSFYVVSKEESDFAVLQKVILLLSNNILNSRQVEGETDLSSRFAKASLDSNLLILIDNDPLAESLINIYNFSDGALTRNQLVNINSTAGNSVVFLRDLQDFSVKWFSTANSNEKLGFKLTLRHPEIGYVERFFHINLANISVTTSESEEVKSFMPVAGGM